MLFPIAIELGDEAHAFGVEVPDLPGCFSAGDSIDDAILQAREAIDLHLEGLADERSEIPSASSVARYQADPRFSGRVWALVDVDITQYLGKAEKINVTLPSALIRRIDDYVGTHPKMTRSGFLAGAALEKLTRA